MNGRWRAISSAALLVGATAVDARGQELFLVHGVGVPGIVEIGQRETAVNSVKLGELRQRFNLIVRSDPKGIVILVICPRAGCVTAGNVAVGMTEDALVRRYGRPVEEQSLRDGRLLRYDGVGFKITQDAVTAIYILPRFRALR